MVETFPPIPIDTAKAARSVFGSGNFYLTTGDQLNCLLAGLNLDKKQEPSQRPTRTQAMLYLITIFQFFETLPDRQASDALATRLDWKYALHLPLNYPGLKAASLCEFRRWLLTDPANIETLQTLLVRLIDAFDRNNMVCFSLDPNQVITEVCQVTRQAKVWETICKALEAAATRQPQWLRGVSRPHWYSRYRSLPETPAFRADIKDLEAVMQGVGTDGFYLIDAIAQSGLPVLNELPELLELKQVWSEHFEQVDGKANWRKQARMCCP